MITTNTNTTAQNHDAWICTRCNRDMKIEGHTFNCTGGGLRIIPRSAELRPAYEVLHNTLRGKK